MSDLKQAIDALAEASPDPAAVEALTAETIRRKETPYTAADVWGVTYIHVGKDGEADVTCLLCGATIHAYIPRTNPFSDASLQLVAHLDWHNSIERRLRALGAA